MSISDLSKKVRPDLFFFIVGFLVFPAVIIISVLSLFNSSDNSAPAVSFPMDKTTVMNSDVLNTEESKVNDSSNEEIKESKVDPGPMTSSINTVRTGHSEDGLEKSEQNKEVIQATGQWNATQYASGDIIQNTYVVQLGDTLWQIAKAYYGDGAQWIKILDNNMYQIGFLPNGEQALIYPDQILNLP